MSKQTIERLLDEGIEAQSRGDLRRAEESYRQVLSLDPNDPDATHLLGIVLYKTNRLPEAIELLLAAVKLLDDAAFHFNLGEALRTSARHEEAVVHYARALDLEPALGQVHLPFAESLAVLNRQPESKAQLEQALRQALEPAEFLRSANCALKVGAPDITVNLATKALPTAPPESLVFWAHALEKTDGYRLLVDIFLRLIAADPKPDYFAGLVSAYSALEDFPNAERAAGEALAKFPESSDIYFVSGLSAQRQNDFPEAIRHYNRAIELHPDHLPTLVNLAHVLRASGRNAEALAHLQHALEKNSESFEVLFNLSLTQKELGNLDHAIAAGRKSLQLKPDDAAVVNSLAICLTQKRKLAEAAALLEAQTAANPQDMDAHCNLGFIYLDRGQVPESLSEFAAAIRINPRVPAIYSNMLLTANYDDAISAQELFDLHLKWVSTQAAPSPPAPPLIAPTRRRIRVGYVSPDFKTHSVVFFACPVLMHHNRDDFEIFCYSDVQNPDHVTQFLQSFGHHWRNVAGLSDEQCLRMIQQDQIDILVDLAGHTSGNRLSVFAARPAPIQVSLIGYPNTTGLAAMDYQVTDAILHPLDAPNSFASEKLLRLPDIFACYRPPENVPPLAPLPALSAGHITFGYFNNLAKLRPFMLRCWAQIARQVPDSRFLIQTSALADEGTRDRLAEECRSAGLPPERIDFKGQSSLAGFHSDLHAVDIGLDPFPFNGHTTSCQMLHMGVPIVTLAGVTRSSRMGASLLTNLRLPELIATTTDHYIKIAVDLAQNLPRLSAIRASLRDRMNASTMLNGPLYTRQLETAYREIWETARKIS